jgi:hypothetical protein
MQRRPLRRPVWDQAAGLRLEEIDAILQGLETAQEPQPNAGTLACATA